MATCVMVADMSSWVPNLMIRVLVLKKWTRVCVRGVEGLDVIVVDEAGTKIQASVTKHIHVSMFDCQIEEGEWYSLSKFAVVNAPVANRSTTHSWCIIMDSNTDVRKIDRRSSSHVIKHRCFGFVINRHDEFHFPIDLLGVISHVGDLDTVRDDNYEGMNKRICKIHFRIRDLQNREIECAARGSLANEFSEMWWRNRNSVVVCELTDWRIFSCEGYSYVVDGGEMSRFEFDPQFPESQELKNKFLITSQHTKMSSNYRFYGQGAIRTPQPLR